VSPWKLTEEDVFRDSFMSLMKINLAEKLAMFDSRCDPHVVANYNGNDVMIVKFAGDSNPGDSDLQPASKPSI
jgi:hypothetical protein